LRIALTLSTADQAGAGALAYRWVPGIATAESTGQSPLGVAEVVLSADDQLVITVPDGGGAITVTCTVYWEELR
jgi:hypothetical protein